jgi:hypothetical protein
MRIHYPWKYVARQPSSLLFGAGLPTPPRETCGRIGVAVGRPQHNIRAVPLRNSATLSGAEQSVPPLA